MSFQIETALHFGHPQTDVTLLLVEILRGLVTWILMWLWDCWHVLLCDKFFLYLLMYCKCLKTQF